MDALSLENEPLLLNLPVYKTENQGLGLVALSSTTWGYCPRYVGVCVSIMYHSEQFESVHEHDSFVIAVLASSECVGIVSR